ncbi:DUF3467 domain-containing protein [Staphylococcus saprophyticus]|uniref:DUF3467 domain-containing protein n=1 Tax=Staphylococcus saprophyticus TaxID=29385 RepID=UPI00119FEE43|nr:DUF3467 domain-containing protein [Staphylococcus saprophyticus]MDW4104132.1 DUF3467 domain-containing protein [Staphylococcus saprophyticus]MDW4205216.1 DUF3467 domain-containing protein [Staphylococcus saprophyticus]
MSEETNYETNFEQSDNYIYGENHEMFYANSLDVQTSITDFMVNFKQSIPNGFLENKKVIMNPSLAKQLKNALEQAIYQHEKMHGEIKDIDTLQIEMSNYYEEE